MKILRLITSLFLLSASAVAQDAHADLAKAFLSSLSSEQRAKAYYEFDSGERYTWNFVPKQDRKGLWLKDMTDKQKDLGFELLKYWVSKQGYEKIEAIMGLEAVLKEMRKGTAIGRAVLVIMYSFFLANLLLRNPGVGASKGTMSLTIFPVTGTGYNPVCLPSWVQIRGSLKKAGKPLRC